MYESKISKVLTCEGLCFKKDMDLIYDQFHDIFLKKEVRPNYKGKFIFFNMSKDVRLESNGLVVTKELYRPERFMHIISLSDTDKYTSDPCYNDHIRMVCRNECDLDKAWGDFSILKRTECYYRLLRIHRIPEVIMLANIKDDDIQEWTEVENRKSNGNNGSKTEKIVKHFIRYKHKIDDYIVILKEDKKRGQVYKYDFVTAFPLFDKESKKEYDKKYQRFSIKKRQ